MINSISKNQFQRSLSSLFVLSLTFLLIPRVSADTGDLLDINHNQIYFWLEGITFVFFILIAIVNFQNHQKIGNSIISLPFIYLFAGLFLTIVARVFLVFNALGLYNLDDMTRMIYWHFFIYLSMIVFLFAIRKVGDRIKDSELSPLSSFDYMIFSIIILAVIALFLTPETIGVSLMEAMMGTFITEIGLLHFIAFTFTVILTIQMFIVLRKSRKTKVGRYMNAIALPFLLFLIITTLNHLTSLLVDSWEVLIIEHEVVTVIDQSFWVVGFAIMSIGYFRLQSEINTTIEDFTETTEISSEVEVTDDPTNENSKIVMNILKSHIGSLAKNIAEKSSKQSGVQLSEINEDNVVTYSEAIERNTTDLIGEFPSRYLKISIQKSIRND